MHYYKGIVACSALLAMTLLSTACNRNTESTRERRDETKTATATHEYAFVRFVDAHHGDADLYFGDTKAFSGTANGAVTDYKQLPAERRELALRTAGQATEKPLATNSEGFGDGKHYTVIAYDDKDPKLVVVNDDESAPAEGKAKVRIIHAAPGMESVNIYAAGKRDKLASESRFSTASTWQEVDPVKGPLEVRTSDQKSGGVRVNDVHLQPGNLYTFVVEGGAKAGEKLHVVSIVDTPHKA